MGKVKLDTIKPWITSKITELLGGMEDDVVIDYVFNQLEADKVIKPFLFKSLTVQVYFCPKKLNTNHSIKGLHDIFFYIVGISQFKRMNGPQVSVLL